jgi:hypothetical protein
LKCVSKEDSKLNLRAEQPSRDVNESRHVMPDENVNLYIQIFDETNPVIDGEQPLFRAAEFGGTMPQVGDLIAMPRTQPDFNSDPRQNPRMRRVVERFFWPTTDSNIPVRICLLVRERDARSSSRKRIAKLTASSTAVKTTFENDVSFLIQQVFTCLKIAKECTNNDTAAALHRLADRAVALGADPDTIPRGTVRSGA